VAGKDFGRDGLAGIQHQPIAVERTAAIAQRSASPISAGVSKASARQACPIFSPIA
jgi:hypothetical protein